MYQRGSQDTSEALAILLKNDLENVSHAIYRRTDEASDLDQQCIKGRVLGLCLHTEPRCQMLCVFECRKARLLEVGVGLSLLPWARLQLW